MKPIVEKSNKKAAFTIVELLTIMSIIIILISLVVPALNQVKRFAYRVKQKNQFHSIGVAIEAFNAEWDGYPESSPSTGPVQDCGAIKLCEAMVGRDLLGYDPTGMYNPNPADLSARTLYLQLENANAYKLKCLYGNAPPPLRELHVLCDEYSKVTYNNPDLADRMNGKRVGMPVLYYKANASNTGHSKTEADQGRSTYDYRDNHMLVGFGMPWMTPPPPNPASTHKLFQNPDLFYQKTVNEKVTISRPHRADSYILFSAGYDGDYGTDDDIFNFKE